jgi:RNA polymerase sigma-70 factor (ECF subfamily)
VNEEEIRKSAAQLLAEHRPRLLRLFEARMPAALRRRLAAEDLLQELSLVALRRSEIFAAGPEIPPFVKLRALALQTLTDLCRHHLGTAKRAAGQEHEADGDHDPLAALADSLSSPRSRLLKVERAAQVRAAVAALAPADREILELRHFEELSNLEAAAVLGIEAKAASARYIRALKRLQEALAGISGVGE